MRAVQDMYLRFLKRCHAFFPRICQFFDLPTIVCVCVSAKLYLMNNSFIFIAAVYQRLPADNTFRAIPISMPPAAAAFADFVNIETPTRDVVNNEVADDDEDDDDDDDNDRLTVISGRGGRRETAL